MGIEGGGSLGGIAIDQIGGWSDREAVPAEEPLVDFKLALVDLLVLALHARGLGGRGGLVVDYDQRAVGLDPDVVDRTIDEEVGGRMERPDPLEVTPPGVEVGMTEGDGINPVLDHQWVRRLARAVTVELLLEQLVDRLVEGEGRTGGSGDAFDAVEPEAAGTLDEELKLGPADLERLGRPHGKELLTRHAASPKGWLLGCQVVGLLRGARRAYSRTTHQHSNLTTVLLPKVDSREGRYHVGVDK